MPCSVQENYGDKTISNCSKECHFPRNIRLQAGERILSESSATFGPRKNSLVCTKCLGKKQDHSNLELSLCCCGLPICDVCLFEEHDEDECNFVKGLDLEADQKTSLLSVIRLCFAQHADRDLASRLDLLMDHNEESNTPKEDLATASKLASENGGQFVFAEVMRSIGLLNTNAIELKDSGGHALFPTFSFISHSCCNNARPVTSYDSTSNAFRIDLFSLVDIEADEEVTITYTNLLRPTLERRQRLEYIWHFRCTCRRCQDPTDFQTFIGGVKCPTCKTMMEINVDEEIYSCSTCHSKIAHGVVKGMEDQFHELLGQTEKTVEALEEFLDFCDPVLNETHFIRVIAKRYLSQLYGPENEEKAKLANELLGIFDKLDPGLSQSRGLTLFELAKTMKANSNQSKTKILQEVLQCLKNDPKDSIAGKAFHIAKKDVEKLSEESRIK